MIEYRKDKHRFFDDLLAMLNSLASLLVTVEYFRLGYSNLYRDPSWPFYLNSKIEQKGLMYYPYALIKIISEDNKWPVRFIEFEETLPNAGPTDIALTLSSPGFIRTSEQIMQSSFIRYYETLNPEVKSKFGSDPQGWPSVWNFARVARNAFAHGGEINFTNLNAASVAWKTQNYSPADNGRQIMFKDISSGDIVFLMAEMDASV
jgi:hypothetical protein